ncbi:MFS transporter [Pelomonas sp. KK5]|uniref:spinster family MFS transporter n=1 Tax=Pelomonas sp. KK5 TaxID=1855730 RepID=UPI00097C0D92|nr:MFS transporter [Pelomonas sp. KK5]
MDRLADPAQIAPPAPIVPPAAPHTLYSPARRWLMLAVLFLVSASSYLDRHIVSVLLEPIKKEFGVSDTQLGLLTGFAFVIFYVALGVPLARWADRGNRRVVVAVSLAVWSAFTALCGYTGSFLQLALARIGVGAGEAGAGPASQSLLADYFPKERRGIVLAIYTSSATVGYLFAFMGGAAIAAHYGWRNALIAVGAPGVVLALIAWLLLAEPREKLGPPVAAKAAVSAGQAMKALLAKRSYVWVLVGAGAYGIVAYGAAIFFPSFMVRSLKVSLTDVGVVYGALSAFGSLGATLLGGFLADRLGKRDLRWYAWLPALSLAVSLPFEVGGLLAPSYTAFLVSSWIGGIALGLGIPSMFTAMHAICGSANRSLAVAFLTFVMSLVGAGMGPLITGFLSDRLTPMFGVESLRYAMVFSMCFLAPAAWAFWRCGVAMPRDIEG